MSLRAFGTRLFKHGTAIVRSLCKREYNSYTIAEKVNPVRETAAVPKQITARNFALRNVGLQVGLHARRLFVDSVLNRVTNSLAAELRRKAARRMLFGDSGPFFALVGVSLASGTGILTKDDELEGICWEIRDAVSRIKWQNTYQEMDETRFEHEPVTLKDLELGQPIAKGCSAVVYAARLLDPSETGRKPPEGPKENPQSRGEATERDVKVNVTVEDSTTEISAEIHDSLTGYPLAVKMMFNYDVQSSAVAILRAMYRETVPARRFYSPEAFEGGIEAVAHVGAHPNLVAMHAVFAERVPELRGALGLYPAALPPRLSPEGIGRNMSLFLLMKRYDCSLQGFLARGEVKGPPGRVSVLLLAQLLEAVAHINMQGVAHRDLKTDNILLDLQEDGAPILALTDFGCCLADRANGLQLPYNSMEIDKGGNTALMAPEVITQTPGTFSVLNYAKSDLWAVGAIAYEIFGAHNPFYNTTKGVPRLRSADYIEEDLPPFPDRAPPLIRMLVANLLRRNPKKRLEVETAANVCQLFLWAPSDWLRTGAPIPGSQEILQWLLCLTTKVLCEGRLSSAPLGQKITQEHIRPRGRRTYPEYLLISSFLKRAKLAYIKTALGWIHQTS